MRGFSIQANEIVLVNDKGDESSRRALIRVGLDNIAAFSRITQRSASEVKNRGEATEVVDVRIDKEWAGGHMMELCTSCSAICEAA